MDSEKEVIIEENKSEEKKCCAHKENTKLNIFVGALTGTLYLVAIIAYLLIGFLAGIWHPSWLVFLAPLVISSFISAIGNKSANRFNYPIFVVCVYILFSSLYGLWHPLWVLFITIPLYYSFINLIKKARQ